MPDLPLSPGSSFVRSFPTPNDLHVYFTEIVSVKNSTYLTGDPATSLVRLKDGDPHPNQVKFPGVKLIYSTPVPNSDEWVTRIWANDRAYADQDFFNWAVSYTDENTGKPVWIRKYLTPRETYVPLTVGSVLGSVVNLKLTAGGSGYTSPVVVFTGGGGTGASGYADINNGGEIVNVEILHGGTGYTSAPTISFTDATGTGATAVAAIQNQDAYLLRQSTEAAPDPYNNLYISVTQIYETLPTVWMYKPVAVDPDTLGITLVKRRSNIAVNIKPGAIIKEGSSGALTAVLTGGVVTSVTISNAGSGYGELVQIIFSGGGTPTRQATGYAWSVNGALSSVVILDGGAGYGSAPTIAILPKTLEITERTCKQYGLPELTEFANYEQVKVVPQPPASDIASALVFQTSESYQFPGRINIAFILQYSPIVDERRPYAINVPVTNKVYWVISDTAPTISLDSLYPDDVFLPTYLDGKYQQFVKVLHDAANVHYVDGVGNSLELYIPATVPSYTEYTGYVPMTGTSITLTNGSTAVTGVGTSFLSQLASGYLINGSTALRIQSVTNDTNAVLAVAFPGDTVTITSFYAVNAVTAWIGNLKNVLGDVTPEQYQKLWRVHLKYIVMK